MAELKKPIEEMTPKELEEFRNSLPVDEMGFDNEEVEGNAEHSN